MLVDVLIVILLIVSLYRGREIGFVRQLLSTIGFFAGLLLGAVLQPHTVTLVQGTMEQAAVTLVTTLGTAFLGLMVGESIGEHIKRRLTLGTHANKADNYAGSFLSVISILIAVWLSATIVQSLPLPRVQSEIGESKIASTLSTHFPFAPNIIAGIGNLVNPNGFPQVFIGSEPNLPDNINIPSSSELAAAVAKDRDSVVKIQGQGCGGIVDGSGFVVGDGFVATNAHVVAGIRHPYVLDGNGTHSATAVWFDPNLDIAILRTPNLAGDPLPLGDTNADSKTAAAVLGYPGGGAFTANPGLVLSRTTAVGRNIYGQGVTNRQIYTVASNVEPGNSGGPLVRADGTVIGVVFAKSVSRDDVGYALTIQPVTDVINQAIARNTAVNTSSCAK